ncbi:TetR family transcriptional regulator C-terminal domain-containing protein [Kitasatospora aureofaciens]|uniref:TetR family transcriptional regulator C-terminal domain-containing protein n=1 Tax=Kitasatospora aureofaciens TaxID=1894 RepID=UPI00068EE19A|nr:TetR family transcriptional regulator C-terminal domain-containing protein [Kitasatospora aureofaciens]HJD84568.1 TetR family transcriptional regulator C-terminal domain-containing protein [Kitasatospora aureofaciens]
MRQLPRLLRLPPDAADELQQPRVHHLGPLGRAFHLIYTEYAVLSVTDPALAGQAFLAAPDEMEAFLATQLTAARRAGTADPRLDARQEAVVLLAVSAGLGLSVLLGQRTADEATAVLRYHLGRVFPH